MYFPATNYRRTDHPRVVFLTSWKYFCLQKYCRELWKVEEKLFLLDKLQQYFGVVFPSFYFNLAIGEVICWYMCQKKSDPKGRLQLIFQLERGKDWKVVLCSPPSG